MHHVNIIQYSAQCERGIYLKVCVTPPFICIIVNLTTS